MFKSKLTFVNTLTDKTTTTVVPCANDMAVLNLIEGCNPHRLLLTEVASTSNPLGGTTIAACPPDPRIPVAQLKIPKSWNGNCHFTAILFQTKDPILTHAIMLAIEKTATDPDILKKKFLAGKPEDLFAYQVLLVTHQLDKADVQLAIAA